MGGNTWRKKEEPRGETSTALWWNEDRLFTLEELPWVAVRCLGVCLIVPNAQMWEKKKKRNGCREKGEMWTGFYKLPLWDSMIMGWLWFILFVIRNRSADVHMPALYVARAPCYRVLALHHKGSRRSKHSQGYSQKHRAVSVSIYHCCCSLNGDVPAGCSL